MQADTAAVPPRRDGLPPQAATELLLGFARCFGVEGRNTVYISTPITSGRFFAAWAREHADIEAPDYLEQLRNDVIAPNLERVRPLVQAARKRWLRRPVLDPTRLDDVPGWAQRDYHSFWTTLIRQHARTVVFADGWAFSNGCALELAAAVAAGCEMLDHTFSALPLPRARDELSRAADELAAAGVDDQVLREAIRLLSSPSDRRAVAG